MTETSFPVVEQPLSDGQWKVLGLAIGQGIVDRGGFPYRMTARNDTNDMVTIDVDRITKKAEAVLDGFAHQMDAPKSLKVPPVTTTTTYEIGLVYDPTKSTTSAGPITLDVWKAPGDYTVGKNRLVLYRIERAPAQVLSQTKYTEYRPRVSPQIVVSTESHLPRAGTMLVDTVALARDTGKCWRAHSDGNNNMVWSVMKQGVEGDPYATPLTAIMRWSTGTGGNVEDPVNPLEVANKRYADRVAEAARKAIPYSSRYAEEAIIMRWGDGRGGNVKRPTQPENIANKAYVDEKTWDGNDITRGTVPYARIGGSKPAYDTPQSGYVYTVSVNSAGKFMRFTSALKYKTDVQPYAAEPAEILKAQPMTFHRIGEDGEPEPRTELGFIADWVAPFIPEAVIYAPNADGVLEVESLDFNAITAAHHTVLQDHERRLSAALEERDAARAVTEALAARVELLESRATRAEETLVNVLERLEALEGVADNGE